MPEPARPKDMAMVAAVIQTVAALCLPDGCLTDLTADGRVQPRYQKLFVEYLEKAREASGQPTLKLKVGVAYHDLVKKRTNAGGSSAYFREGYEKDVHWLPMGEVSVTSVGELKALECAFDEAARFLNMGVNEATGGGGSCKPYIHVYGAWERPLPDRPCTEARQGGVVAAGWARSSSSFPV